VGGGKLDEAETTGGGKECLGQIHHFTEGETEPQGEDAGENYMVDW